ncbi:beta-glucuronidase isoform X2 [Anabrus simplex]|uniref:beta-glucuronidase isoform X2 n=1 Tax=Anabrus simplex TaxID=316456 RepID=UPI0035A27D3B
MEQLIKLFLLSATFGAVASSDILYPRESESREVKSLDGIWKFSISPKGKENIGFIDEWYSSYHKEWISMPVPSSYNDVTTDAAVRDFVGWSWYQRTFFIPRRWKIDDQRIFLRFGSVHYVAKVWVNGKEAGQHVGGHLPFVFDVTNLVDYKTHNLVTVALNNTLTRDTIPQGYVLHPNDTEKYPPGYVINKYSFDFFNYAGIHRPVFLYTTPQNYIDDITVLTHVDGTTGIVEYKVSFSIGRNDIATQVDCYVTLLDQDGATVAKNAGCQDELRVQNPTLWWPIYMNETAGYLYTFQVLLSANGIQDIYRLPIGIRTISWGRDLRINSKPVYLHGFGKHEDSNLRGKGLDYTLLLRDHNLISWIGANCYRTSHYPYAEEAMDMADSQGILIINESPAVNLDLFSAEMLTRHKSVMKEMVARDKNRPSTIMWSVSNEAHTAKNKSGPYYEELVAYIKTLDPTRPVTFVTNQNYKLDKAAPYVDVIGVNRYFSWYSDPGLLELVTYQVLNELTGWYETFKKPVYMSEYGADALPGLHSLPVALWTEDYQAALLYQYFRAFDELREMGFFIGELIWNFADFATAQVIVTHLRCLEMEYTDDQYFF